MVWLRIIIAAIMSLYGAHLINKRKNLGNNYKFDKHTKISILKDQLKILIDVNCLESEREDAKKYALVIINELLVEFNPHESKIDFLNKLSNDINFNSDNKDLIKPYINKIWIL